MGESEPTVEPRKRVNVSVMKIETSVVTYES